MSEASVKRIAAEFLQQVDVACAEGRAEEIFTAFHRAIGSDFAETMFLSISSKRERATAKTARWFSRWIESFAHQMSLELVDPILIDQAKVAVVEAVEGIAETHVGHVGNDQKRDQQEENLVRARGTRRRSKVSRACIGSSTPSMMKLPAKLI